MPSETTADTGSVRITELSDEEILAIADPWWDELVKYSNNANYLKFIKNFSKAFREAANEMEVGKQFARSELARNLAERHDYLGIIRRGDYVTVLYRQYSKKSDGEWLGRLVLGFEDGEPKIFGATLF